MEKTYRIDVRTTNYKNIRFCLTPKTSEGENQEPYIYVGEGLFLKRRMRRAKKRLALIMELAGYSPEPVFTQIGQYQDFTYEESLGAIR